MTYEEIKIGTYIICNRRCLQAKPGDLLKIVNLSHRKKTILVEAHLIATKEHGDVIDKNINIHLGIDKCQGLEIIEDYFSFFDNSIAEILYGKI